MPELTDHDLLADFARSESEEAFGTLVKRYVNLVYSTALRFTDNSHHAEEITQAVFIILARKAGKISPRVVLSGWLYQTARLTAANFMKAEIRRQRREQEAYMQSTLNDPGSTEWQQIAPLLDDAMGRLGETDRNAVVLRFFENKTAAEVASTLHLTEAAAHKRTNRALDKLRRFFFKGRRDLNDIHHRECHFCAFDSYGARCGFEIRDAGRYCERRCPRRFHPDSCKRNIKNYGLD